MSAVPKIQDILDGLNEFVVAELRRYSARGEPLSQEVLEAIRESAHQHLIAKISDLEYLRDSAFRESQHIEASLEVSQSFRAVLKDG